jgi:precorrin-6B methylase 2
MSAPAITADSIMRIGFGFWASKALFSAVELGLFTHLARGPADGTALSRDLGLHQRSARDFLDALVALRLIERNGETYANTPEADRYLDRGKPSYIGGVLDLASQRLWSSWGSLTEALRTGLPQNEMKEGAGSDLFEAVYNDPERLRIFLKGMTGTSLPTAQRLAELFPWKQVRTFADIGTAEGGLPVTLVREHPHLKGIGFDLPQVRPVFEDYVEANGLAGRVVFHGGDFFKEPLPTADVLVMGHILHDWNQEEKDGLLAKAYEALPSGGALVVYEMLIDDDRQENLMGLLMSLNMLVETTGGFDYTGADCVGWMRSAGFRDTRVEHLAGPYWAVIGIK